MQIDLENFCLLILKVFEENKLSEEVKEEEKEEEDKAHSWMGADGYNLKYTPEYFNQLCRTTKGL